MSADKAAEFYKVGGNAYVKHGNYYGLFDLVTITGITAASVTVKSVRGGSSGRYTLRLINADGSIRKGGRERGDEGSTLYPLDHSFALKGVAKQVREQRISEAVNALTNYRNSNKAESLDRAVQNVLDLKKAHDDATN